MPRLITNESNQRANERKKEAWQAKGNVTRLVDEKRIQNGLFTAKLDGRRQNWMALINTGSAYWQNTYRRSMICCTQSLKAWKLFYGWLLWINMMRNMRRKIAYSITRSPSLFHLPGITVLFIHTGNLLIWLSTVHYHPRRLPHSMMKNRTGLT